MENSQLRQIYVGTTASSAELNSGGLVRQHETLQDALLRLCPAYLWPKESYRACCPGPILIGKNHQQQLESLHGALTIAITDIVSRWWTDHEARFPERMPLEKQEENLLKWLDGQVARGTMRPFSACLGSWRPDFLVETRRFATKEVVEERFIITEINARFSFNGFVHEAYGQQALYEVLLDAGVEDVGLVNATEPMMVLGGLFDLFQPNLPLHLLKGAEAGIDIHMFIDAVWRRFTQKPKLITPEDLRLVPDSQCKTGYQLCCVSKQKGDINDNSVPSTLFNHKGEKLEKIHQVGLELHQQELAALEPELLRHLSLCCFNDMRTILLVHDKRMLGIIRQEIPKMLTRKLLDKDQASILESGIVETILPGSQEMQALLQASEHSLRLQNDYILKPIRGGKGIGIVFGEDLDCDEWLAELRRLQSPGSGLSSGCVAQRRIIPCEYDLMLKPSGVMEKYPLVGTYHVTNGRLLGLGTWRASSGRIVAVSSGGSWICSVMHR